MEPEKRLLLESADLTPLNSGSIFIKDIPHSLPEARKNLSYLPERFSFFPNASVKETLEFLRPSN